MQNWIKYFGSGWRHLVILQLAALGVAADGLCLLAAPVLLALLLLPLLLVVLLPDPRHLRRDLLQVVHDPEEVAGPGHHQHVAVVQREVHLDAGV